MRSPLIAAVLVLIVGLQDSDEISHAGSIPVFGDSRNLSIGCGLASLPEPHEEIGDVSHGVFSAANCGSRHQLSGNAPLTHDPDPKGRASARCETAFRRSRKAGGRYAADPAPQLPAR